MNVDIITLKDSRNYGHFLFVCLFVYLFVVFFFVLFCFVLFCFLFLFFSGLDNTIRAYIVKGCKACETGGKGVFLVIITNIG